VFVSEPFGTTRVGATEGICAKPFPMDDSSTLASAANTPLPILIEPADESMEASLASPWATTADGMTPSGQQRPPSLGEPKARRDPEGVPRSEANLTSGITAQEPIIAPPHAAPPKKDPALQRLNPEDLLQPERRNETGLPASFVHALEMARKGTPVSAKQKATEAGAAGGVAPSSAKTTKKPAPIIKPAPAATKPAPTPATKPAPAKPAPSSATKKSVPSKPTPRTIMISAAPDPTPQQLLVPKEKPMTRPVSAKGKGGAAKGAAKKQPGKRRVSYELPSSSFEENSEDISPGDLPSITEDSEEGSYTYTEVEDEGSYSDEEGSYSDDGSEGSYSDEEEDDDEGSYSEEDEEEAPRGGSKKRPATASKRPSSSSAASKRPTSSASASKRPSSSAAAASKRPSSSAAAASKRPSSSASATKRPSSSRPSASRAVADTRRRPDSQKHRPSSLQRKAVAASRRAFDEDEGDEEDEGEYSDEDEGSYSDEDDEEDGSYSDEEEEGSYEEEDEEDEEEARLVSRKRGRTSSGDRSARASRPSSDDASTPLVPPPPRRSAGKPASQKKDAGAEERQVLALAIREQEKALKGLHRDLKVLRQIEAAWSIDEEEARRQGIGAQDMALINAFDDEDVAKVREVIVKVSAILDTLESEFGQHLRSYQEAITSMETILETRAQVINRLDRTTGIFSRYPELSEFVAGKQTRLAKAMENTQRALLDGFATSLAKVQMTQGQIRDMIHGAATQAKRRA